MSKHKELTDLALIKRIQKFDPRALEEIYNRYSPLMFTLIKKICGDEKTSENILVEVFKIIWLKSDQFDIENGSVYTWLITLARNRAVDTARRSRNSKSTQEFYNEDYENAYVLPSIIKHNDKLNLTKALKLKDKVEAALGKLTDAQQYVILLAYYEGLTIDEIAAKLNLPVETVRSKVAVSLDNFNNHLKEA